MEISEKVAYLKGLVEGFGFDANTKEGKVILAVVDLLDDLALSVSDLEDSVELLSEQMSELDEDLSDMIEDYFDDDEGDGAPLYEITCPACDNSACIDLATLEEGGIACPNCGEQLEFDLEGLELCDCGHFHAHGEDEEE